MLGNLGIHIIVNPSGTYSYVGSSEPTRSSEMHDDIRKALDESEHQALELAALVGKLYGIKLTIATVNTIESRFRLYGLRVMDATAKAWSEDSLGSISDMLEQMAKGKDKEQ